MTSHPSPARSARRILAIAVAAGAVAATLTGCSSGGSASATTINIVVHDNPATTTALKNMTAGFEKANPDIKVNLSFIPTNDYPATRTSRLAAKKVDIVEGPGGGPTATPNPSYTSGLPESDWVKGVEAGQWVDMSKQSFVKDFTPSVMSALAVNGKTYQIPTALVYYTGVYYNKDLFKKANVSVPKTWPAFVSTMAKLKKANITPLSAAGKDQWPVGLAALALMRSEYPSQSDMKSLDQSLWDGKASLADSKNVAIADKLKTMYSYMDPTFAGVDYATAEGQFTGGQAAMTVDGTWAVQQFETQNPALKMGYFPLPAADTASANKGLQGKIDQLSFAIPTSSTHQKAALKWIAYYADPKNYAQFAKTGGVIPVEQNISTSSSIDKVLGSSTDGTFNLAWDQIYHANPKSGPNVGTNGINFAGLAPLGKFATPVAAQDASQKDWLAGLAK